MDTSIHDWTEGRGEDMVLIHMIDDATSRLLARFYDADTVLNHFDLLVCSFSLPASRREYPRLGSREEVFRSAEARPLAAD
jgi:hypothetical protein